MPGMSCPLPYMAQLTSVEPRRLTETVCLSLLLQVWAGNLLPADEQNTNGRVPLQEGSGDSSQQRGAPRLRRNGMCTGSRGTHRLSN